jgi:hypothetical protein
MGRAPPPVGRIAPRRAFSPARKLHVRRPPLLAGAWLTTLVRAVRLLQVEFFGIRAPSGASSNFFSRMLHVSRAVVVSS